MLRRAPCATDGNAKGWASCGRSAPCACGGKPNATVPSTEPFGDEDPEPAVLSSQELQREMLGLPSAAARVDSHPCKVSGRPHTSTAEHERGTASSCIGHRFVRRQALPCGAMPALPSGLQHVRSDEVWEVREIIVGTTARRIKSQQPEYCENACTPIEQKGGVVWLGSAALDGTERATTPQEALFVEEISASPRASICGQLALWVAGGTG